MSDLPGWWGFKKEWDEQVSGYQAERLPIFPSLYFNFHWAPVCDRCSAFVANIEKHDAACRPRRSLF